MKITDLDVSFENNLVLSRLSFELDPGSVVGLIGPSAGGKSTLMKILGKVYQADSGEVDFGEVQDCDVSLMFQEGALFDSISVFDNVVFPLVDGNVPIARLAQSKRSEVTEKVAWILNRVGLLNAAFKMPAQISGGMRRRVSLARALVSNPRVALLDDPTAGLDPVASSVIMELILELHNLSKPTTIIVSHDLRRLLPVCDKVMALFHGSIVFNGPVSDLISAPTEVQEFVACRYDLKPESEYSKLS